MKKKKLIAIVLVAAMIAQGTSYSAWASEFSDGTEVQSEIKETAQMPGNENEEETFSSGQESELFTSEEERTSPEEVTVNGNTYVYHPETDSYFLESAICTGETVVIESEVEGKKVTGISSEIFDALYEAEFTIYAGDVLIPDTVTTIENSAFLYGSCVKMELPDSVTEIGTELFKYCSNLRYLYFTGGVEVFPRDLFKDCSKLRTIEIGYGVTEIADQALKGCSALEELHIPSSVKKIGKELFEPGAQVTVFGEKGSAAQVYAEENKLAFVEEGTQLPPSVDRLELNGVWYAYQKKTDSYAVTGYSGNVSEAVDIPEEVNGKKVTEIDDGAFECCLPMKQIHIPGTVKKIGDRALARCSNLKNVRIDEGITSIGEEAFMDIYMEILDLPDSITSIGDRCFALCGFDELHLPAGLEKISDEMMYNLWLDSELEIPKGVTAIGDGAFRQFNGKGILLPDTVTEIGDSAFYNADIPSLHIPGSVRKIGEYAFYASFATIITIGNGIKNIPTGAFGGCRAEMLILPDSVTSIQEDAFSETNLYRLSVPAGVKFIDKEAFSDNPYLTLYVKKNSLAERYAKYAGIPYDNGSIDMAVVVKDGVRYQYDAGMGGYRITDVDTNIEGSLTIPSVLNGKKVVEIGQEAFYSCEKLTEVVLPDTVTSIEESGFNSCGMKNIRISSSLKEIGARAFEGSGLEKIILPDSVTSMGKAAFRYCRNLKEAKLPAAFTEIPEETFGACSALAKVKLPQNLKIIRERAFSYSGLTEILLPETLQSIEEFAFTGCSELKEITIPGSVETLPRSSFGDCTLLEKVVLEDGVRNMELNAFEGSEESIREMHMTDSVDSVINVGWFKNCTFYGFAGTWLEELCAAEGCDFVAVGTAAFVPPVLSAKVSGGNNVSVFLSEQCRNAKYLELVVSKDKNFPQTGRYLYKCRVFDMAYKFETLDKGTYYIFGRGERTRGTYTSEPDIKEYTDWCSPRKVVISDSISPSKVQKVSVKGSTVTVSVRGIAGASGYGIVISDNRSKSNCQKLLKPSGIRYASKNNKSTTYVFKNVKPGIYCVLARTYKKGSGGNVYSRWSGYSKRITV